MKKNLFLLATVFVAGLTFCGCSKDDDNTSGGSSGASDSSYQLIKLNDSIPYATSQAAAVNQTALLKTFAETIVEPTYADMKTGNQALLDAVNKFVTTPTQANMNDCADAWLNARAPWERSEAYLFGPVDNFRIDPNIDTWPLAVGDITQILQAADWGKLDSNGEKEDPSQEIKGYHTLEYLIFSNGQARQIATDDDYKANSTNWGIYMQKVAEMLVKETKDLYDYWFITPKYEGNTVVFKEYFLGDTYPNPVGDIIEGCSGIAEEVGTSKIGGPYEKYAEDPEKAVYEVESWYSWHSRDDYMNNIRGIQFTYLGTRTMTRPVAAASSLSSLVSNKLGVDYDNKVRAAINLAIASINTIPQPFRNNIHSTEAKKAMEACAALMETLDKMQADLGLN